MIPPRPIFDTLSWEDAILDTPPDSRGRFYFAVHTPSVVIGKNQNPWREADLPLARRLGVAIARRVTGGGTVYHDEGNLNYGVLLPRAAYRMETVFAWVLDALRALGIEAERGEGHGLFHNGRKFSGTAFCYRGPWVLHHGTLLVRSDLARLRAICGGGLGGIETRAIPSRPAHVMNLRDARSDLDLPDVAASLAAAFEANGLVRIEPGEPPGERARFQSWDWVYGHTPAFTLADRGGARITVEKGLRSDTGASFDGAGFQAL